MMDEDFNTNEFTCPVCERTNVILIGTVRDDGIALCKACLGVWADDTAHTWEELKRQSLASGNKWFEHDGTRPNGTAN